MRHNRRLKRLIGSGFTGRPSGFFFGTLTAPGRDQLPFDESKCTHKPGRPCSGDLGCVVHEMDAAMWNACAPQAWSWFMSQLRRELPGVDVQFWKCWETQKRGMLHGHAIVWALGVTEARMKRAWEEALKHGFVMDKTTGYRFDWGTQWSCDRIGSKLNVEELMAMGITAEQCDEIVAEDTSNEQRRFTRYGAKYCTKGGNRASVVNRRTGELRHNGSGYRTWSASKRWGDRMKQIRAAQRAWIASRGPVVGGADAGPGSEATLDPDTDFYAQPMGEEIAMGGVEVIATV